MSKIIIDGQDLGDFRSAIVFGTPLSETNGNDTVVSALVGNVWELAALLTWLVKQRSQLMKDCIADQMPDIDESIKELIVDAVAHNEASVDFVLVNEESEYALSN